MLQVEWWCPPQSLSRSCACSFKQVCFFAATARYALSTTHHHLNIDQMSSQGKKSKSKSGRKSALASSQGNASERVPSLPVDPRWCPMNALPFGDSYFNCQFPSVFSHAMVNDSKNWAHPRTARWDLQTIARAVQNVVMPRFSELRAWRQHVSDHLGRLCEHRRKEEDKTERTIDLMIKRITQTNGYAFELRDHLTKLKARVKELEDKFEKFERLPRHHRGARSSSPAKHDRRTAGPGRPGNGGDIGPDPERGRSPCAGIDSDDDNVPMTRSLPSMILEAQLNAISERSRSPGPDSIAVWREYSNSPGPQRFVNILD